MVTVASTPNISGGERNVFHPASDVREVVESEIKEWHFHIYFLQRNEAQHKAAIELRDAVLRLRRDGAFVAVPLYKVNVNPIGPHPAGSYEIWCPSESFVTVFSYLCQNRGELSVLVHPLTRDERADHEVRSAWLGPSFPLNLDSLPIRSPEVPSQYHSLKMGYSSQQRGPSIEERKRAGAKLEEALKGEGEAAPAPRD